MPEEIIEQSIAAEVEGASFDVYADNLQIVEAFRLFDTQWRVAVGMGAVVYLGLDYTRWPTVLAMMDIGDPAECLHGIRTMERAALRVLNARSSGASDGW